VRSTRATAAVARLNSRSEGSRYTLSVTGAGLFRVQEKSGEVFKPLCEALPLDEFVRFVDALGPQKVRRVTKNDAAFARQLVRKR
jgi:hypothetical protein